MSLEFIASGHQKLSPTLLIVRISWWSEDQFENRNPISSQADRLFLLLPSMETRVEGLSVELSLETASVPHLSSLGLTPALPHQYLHQAWG